jgi:tRNA (guanine37-N1)-methyltransferase
LPAETTEAGAEPEFRLTVRLISLFPTLFQSWLEQGVVSRAIAKGIVRIDRIDLRRFGVGRHQVTDDYPFGGGGGMVMKPEPLFAAVESLEVDPPAPVILLSPRGRRFDERIAHELAALSAFTLISGHYEGVDERVREHLVTDEISLGDYVLSAGELAAMVVTDAVVRLLPGALSDGSAEDESFSHGLLEYPQYTRPAEFRGLQVPSVLLSGHHEEIARWRRQQSVRLTATLRPDLLEDVELTVEERQDIARPGAEADDE